MAERETPNAGTGRDEPEDARASTEKEEPRLSYGARLLSQIGEVALAGAQLGGKGAAGGLRATMPVLELYSGTTKARQEEIAKEDPEAAETGLVKLGLTPGEAGVVRAAFSKALLETLEIASVTHAPYEGAPAYVAYGEDGQINPPQMTHFMALGSAAKAVWRDWGVPDISPDTGTDVPDIDVPPQPAPPPPSQTVAYIAVEPGEYPYIDAPQPPSQIRRYAMRQRSISQPQPAMQAYSGGARSLAAYEAAPSPMMHSGSFATAGATAPVRYTGATAPAHYTAAPAKSCGCGTGQATRVFPPARYNEDGTCANLFDISCETKWRIRECFKIGLCDLMRCMADEFCDSEEPDIGRCLEDFLCSLLRCLPEAICPPHEVCEPCCTPEHDLACHCNFAVGK